MAVKIRGFLLLFFIIVYLQRLRLYSEFLCPAQRTAVSSIIAQSITGAKETSEVISSVSPIEARTALVWLLFVISVYLLVPAAVHAHGQATHLAFVGAASLQRPPAEDGIIPRRKTFCKPLCANFGRLLQIIVHVNPLKYNDNRKNRTRMPC